MSESSCRKISEFSLCILKSKESLILLNQVDMNLLIQSESLAIRVLFDFEQIGTGLGNS